MLDNLEHSNDIESCQWACQINPMCNFFTFAKDKSVCILHRADIRHRSCDIIHGPPMPSIQSCLNDMAIPWASSSGEPFFIESLNVPYNTYYILVFAMNVFQYCFYSYLLTTGLAAFMPKAVTTTGKMR